ncbi:MAG: HAMP domain-containing sensor histidine kinase [Elusimicrobiales bacterium]|nr:HAMP domain-containing sensor histidine kinase [Elusimicrobiales bacterium]
MNDQETAKYARLIRTQVVLASGISLAAAGVIFLLGGPLPRALGYLGLLSAAAYSCYYLVLRFYPPKDSRWSNSMMGLLAAAILTPAVHLTGGIVSPFVFMFFSVLVSEALYGLDETWTLQASLAGYLLVVAGEYSGVLASSNPWALEIYASLPVTALIAGITTAYLVLTRLTSRLILANLRKKVTQEAADKDALLRKFSELNSTAQIGVLAHRIAHDLRGPIASVSGYLEMEGLRKKSPEELADLKSVSETVEAMVESLHGITRFGKPGGPSTERIVLAEFLRDLLAIVTFSPQARWVKFSPGYRPGEPAATVASRADLQQAFFNIVKNAVEAVSDNPDAKTVEIGIEVKDKEVLVSVSDNGPGVPEEILRAAFRKSITTKKGGTGVGLIIARDLLVRNGGDIKLRNREGGGLTVAVSLRAA